ncbi:MAG: hypothetical protein KKD28_10090 [Chloroflexi bacterium]|nr:hypothetical protein [Chloroflexota bacterium]MBU1661808.1 hypothetical protein [Chloroflexota bacterium]
MPPGLPAALFSLNWNNPAGSLVIVSLQDPGGSAVTPDERYVSDTHEQWRVNNPKDGVWALLMRIPKPTNDLEYYLTLSGKTDTTLIAAVGGDPAERTVGVPVPIYGILTDYAPIKGADVFALVAGPGIAGQPGVASATGSTLLTLYDDGNHGDGKPDDGLYANILPGLTAPGGYTVKVVAIGTNNYGDFFMRYANAGFNVLPRLAYVWDSDKAIAIEYESLLEANGWVVDLIHLNAVPQTYFGVYEMIIIGPDTGYLGNWGTTDALEVIVSTELPILGLGEGGYAFFGKLDLDIGHGNGAHGSGTSIDWANSGDRIWNTPYVISLPKVPLQLYKENSGRVDIYLGSQPTGVVIFGYNDNNNLYADLILEDRVFLLWGFGDGPIAMTETGQRLFVNTTYRTIP